MSGTHAKRLTAIRSIARLVRMGCALAALATAACGTCSSDAPARSSISFTWSLIDTNGRSVTCDGVAAAFVSLTSRSRTTGESVGALFPCAENTGTQLVALGLHDVSIALHATDGTTLATVPDRTVIVTAEAPAPVFAPIVVTFIVNASLDLSWGAALSVANCTPTDQGGAGITSFTLSMERSQGGCAAVTFLRKRGEIVTGTYPVNCSAPQAASCLETDERLLLSTIAPGSYVVRVRGNVSGLECWETDSLVEVRPGRPNEVTLRLSPRAIRGCPRPEPVLAPLTPLTPLRGDARE